MAQQSRIPLPPPPQCPAMLEWPGLSLTGGGGGGSPSGDAQCLVSADAPHSPPHAAEPLGALAMTRHGGGGRHSQAQEAAVGPARGGSGSASGASAASPASTPGGGASPLRRSGAGPSGLGIGGGPGWLDALQAAPRGAGAGPLSLSAAGAAGGTAGATGGGRASGGRRPPSELDRALSHLALQRAASMAAALAGPPGGSAAGAVPSPHVSFAGVPNPQITAPPRPSAAPPAAASALRRAVTCIKSVRHVGLSAASKGVIVNSISDGALASFVIIQVGDGWRLQVTLLSDCSICASRYLAAVPL